MKFLKWIGGAVITFMVVTAPSQVPTPRKPAAPAWVWTPPPPTRTPVPPTQTPTPPPPVFTPTPFFTPGPTFTPTPTRPPGFTPTPVPTFPSTIPTSTPLPSGGFVVMCGSGNFRLKVGGLTYPIRILMRRNNTGDWFETPNLPTMEPNTFKFDIYGLPGDLLQIKAIGANGVETPFRWFTVTSDPNCGA